MFQKLIVKILNTAFFRIIDDIKLLNTVNMSNIDNGNGECFKVTTTQPKCSQQVMATNGSLIQQDNPLPSGGIQLASKLKCVIVLLKWTSHAILLTRFCLTKKKKNTAALYLVCLNHAKYNSVFQNLFQYCFRFSIKAIFVFQHEFQRLISSALENKPT